MNPPPNREVAIFSAALELPASQRAAYLDGACADDPDLRLRLEALLRDHEAAGGFLETPPPGAQGSPIVAEVTGATIRNALAPSEKAGDRIGRYKLLQQIGEGGCGVVYMAEQEEPVRRRVALKVIKLGMDTKQVIARFEAERQAVALMDHPNIAKVFDAGTTDTGRPYFVMELVRGIKITEYCDQNDLSTEDRLKLFTQVCQAIQHAHQKGIIHRDIKPSNILVTISEPGAPGCPKVIDFGIAKATGGQPLTDKTVFTAFEQFIGTPAYMSPEQALMTSLDIDTRTDIYALGVLLDELLTGQTPFDAKELMAAGLDAMRRIIREQEPLRPSTRLSTLLAADLTTVAQHRQCPAPKLFGLMRGDLDWIVMKALEKDRARRYETANGLAMDIQRHLNCEPVAARPPSRLYEFQKTVRRHKFGFAAAAALITVLAVGVSVSTLEAFRAKTEAAKATAVSDLLRQMLSSAIPDGLNGLKGPDYTVRQLLDYFSAGLGTQLARQPEVEASVRSTIGRAYDGLELPDKAQRHFERALALRRLLYGEQSEEVADSLVDLAWNLLIQGHLRESESAARRALDIYHQRGTGAPSVIHALSALQDIWSVQGRWKETESAAEEAFALARKTPGSNLPELADITHHLADAKLAQGELVDAEKLALKALEMHRRLQGSEHPETAWSLLVLGRALSGQHKWVEAEAALREALRIFRKYFSWGNQSVDQVTAELTSVLEALGDSTGLVAIYQDKLVEQRAALGNANPAVAETLVSLANALQALGKWAEAEKALGEVLDIISKVKGQVTGNLPSLVGRLAVALKKQGKQAEARRTALQAAQIYQTALPQYERLATDQNRHRESWSFAISYAALGGLLKDLGEMQEAEKAYLGAQILWRKLVAEFNTEDYRCHLAVNYDALGKLLKEAGRAAESLETYRQAHAIWFKLVAEFHWEDRRAHLGLSTENIAQLLNEAGRFDEATQSYRQAAALWQELAAEFNKDWYREHLSTTLASVSAALQTQSKRAGGESVVAPPARIR